MASRPCSCSRNRALLRRSSHVYQTGTWPATRWCPCLQGARLLPAGSSRRRADAPAAGLPAERSALAGPLPSKERAGVRGTGAGGAGVCCGCGCGCGCGSRPPHPDPLPRKRGRGNPERRGEGWIRGGGGGKGIRRGAGRVDQRRRRGRGNPERRGEGGSEAEAAERESGEARGGWIRGGGGGKGIRRGAGRVDQRRWRRKGNPERRGEGGSEAVAAERESGEARGGWIRGVAAERESGEARGGWIRGGGGGEGISGGSGGEGIRRGDRPLAPLSPEGRGPG
ncbi:MAG: hypothetical protein KatS3mg102_0634 [Planctomycetota bacterium]|nr:MAG: hypothetical protein KatS3mg102_0634 [Planctomycetota bacterium]